MEHIGSHSLALSDLKKASLSHEAESVYQGCFSDSQQKDRNYRHQLVLVVIAKSTL